MKTFDLNWLVMFKDKGYLNVCAVQKYGNGNTT